MAEIMITVPDGKCCRKEIGNPCKLLGENARRPLCIYYGTILSQKEYDLKPGKCSECIKAIQYYSGGFDGR